MIKKLLVLFSVWALGLSAAIGGAESPAKIEIEYSDEYISADVENAPLEDVLSKITEKTGLAFFINDDVTDTLISTAFKDLDLDKGLKKILSRTNYAFVYGPDRTIMKVAIFGKIKQEFPDLVPDAPPRLEIEPEPAPEPPGEVEVVPVEPAQEEIATPPSGEPMTTQPSAEEPTANMNADGNGQEAPASGN